MVMDGKIARNAKIRNGVVHEGELIALKRFKDDVKVAKGYDVVSKLKDIISKKEMLLNHTKLLSKEIEIAVHFKIKNPDLGFFDQYIVDFKLFFLKYLGNFLYIALPYK
jgi:ubiquinone biosynthesis protein Coq4